MSELLTADQTATFLGVKPQTLSVWRLYKEGPSFVRVGRLIRYRRSDVEAWLTAQTVKVG